MTLAEVPPLETPPVRSACDVRAAGRRAAEMLAEAERLRAAAVACLVDYHDGHGPIIDGYLTPQRHLIVEAGVADRDANRLQRLTRFCLQHPLVAEQLAAGAITISHADALVQVADHVNDDEFTAALTDLLGAAEGVELSVFIDRIRTWQWRITPEATDPDPTNTLEPARTLAQRNADRLVDLCGRNLTDPTDEPADPCDPEGARQGTRSSVDVVLDLPTLLGVRFDLDDHRDGNGDVDWDSITAGFALTGSAPRPVLAQFFCDASWRTLITSGGSVVLDYTHAKPELNRSQRRAVQRRDRHCQFHGCDRAVRFAH